MSETRPGEKSKFRLHFVFASAVAAALLSQAQSPDSRDLTQASLEELMNLKITSVSKEEQQVSKTGAAIYVITRHLMRSPQSFLARPGHVL